MSVQLRPARIRTDEVRDIESLASLASPWRRLCAQSSATPFQYPEWILPWWRHFAAARGELRALALYDTAREGEMVALVPLWGRQDDNGVRHLALIGTGNSDYVDLVVERGFETTAVLSIARYLADIDSEWDACDLVPLPPSSPLAALATFDGRETTRERWGVYPRLQRDDASRALTECVPPSLLHRLQYARRRLSRRGEVWLERAGDANALALFHELVRLHEARWQERGEAGVLADECTRRFHQDVVVATAARGLLRLHALRVSGQAVAACYGFSCGGCLYYYLGGYDPLYERESVGSLAILAAIEDATARGDSAIDFLWGAEPYKYRWGAVDRTGHRVSIRARAVSAAVP